MTNGDRHVGHFEMAPGSHQPARERTVSKHAYYAGREIGRHLAKHYFTHFPNTGRLLDLGCGTGDIARYKPPEMEMYGVDIDSGAIGLAAKHMPALCLNVEHEALPYPDATFDGVLARDILEHVNTPASVVREVHRVLRPGGVLVVSVIMARPTRVWADYTHVRGFTRKAAGLLLEDQGFAVTSVWPMGGVPLSERFGFVRAVPYLLRVPGFSQLWASSWELVAVKPG